MFRRRCLYFVSTLLAAGLSGCSVDLNTSASDALQSVLNSLFAVISADLVNGLIPVG